VNNAVMFSKASDEWSTPQDFWDELNVEFMFEIDVAASADNYKVDDYFTMEDDALKMDWGGLVCWLNPPYSKCREFIAKSVAEAKKGATVVCLVPSRTDTRWWHEHVWDREKHQPRAGVEIRFIKGRLKFGGATAGAPFPSVVIVFRPVR
jgi:phage N-6-adenine-methyltransferase